MHDSGSSIELVTSKEADEVVKDVCWASSGAEDTIAHYIHSFRYVVWSLFVRNAPGDSIVSIVDNVVGDVPLASGGDAAFCIVLNQLGSSEDVRYPAL